MLSPRPFSTGAGVASTGAASLAAIDSGKAVLAFAGGGGGAGCVLEFVASIAISMSLHIL